MPFRIRKRIAFELFRHYRRNAVQLHELNRLFWESTLRCNLQCLHCGSDCSADSGKPDMPLNDFLKALDSIEAQIPPRKLFLIFSGGEPLMRKDLDACGREVTRRGYKWGMVTNGLALSEARLDALLEAGLQSVSISLDGLRKSHNQLRNHPNSYDHALRAIELVRKVPGLTFDVITCVSEMNINELDDVRDLLISMRVKQWRINTIFPVGRASENPQLQLSPAGFRMLMDFIVRTRKEKCLHLSYSCEGFLGNYEGQVRDSFYFCRAGINYGSILADGSISACPNLRGNFIQGNIYDDDFMDVWNTRFRKHRNRDWTKKESCATCDAFKYCEGNGLHLYNDQEELQICHLHNLHPELVEKA